MGNFILAPSFKRYFHSNDDFVVINMGYDDFAHVKPAHTFYVQNFYTWHFVISGSGRLELGGRVYELSGGDSFFIPPDVKMRYFPNPEDPWEYVWFALRGNAAAQYGEQLGFSIENAAHPCRQFGRTKSILKRTIDRLETGECGYFGVLSAFYELMDLSTAERRPRTEIEAVRELVDKSFAVIDFSIAQLCLDVGFSHPQLLRLFKREYGKTLKQYVIEKRIELACELLEGSDLSVLSVAVSCGFSDEIHFMKTFKSRIGMTAAEYRKSCGNKIGF